MIKEDKIDIEISPKIGPDQEIKKRSIMIAKIESKEEREDKGVKEEIEEIEEAETEIEIEIKAKEDKEIEITITEEEIIQEIKVMKEEAVIEIGIVTIDNIGIEIDKEELKRFKKILILSKEGKFKE
jgi:hypothetical protein